MRTYKFDDLYFGPYYMITKEEKDYETYFTSNQFMPNVKRKAKFIDYGIFEKNKNGLIINPETEKNILQRDTIIYQDTYCILGMGTKYIDNYMLKPLKNFVSKELLNKNKINPDCMDKFDIENLLEYIKKSHKLKTQKNEFEM